MGILDTIADLIWKRIKPEVDELQATAQKELDEWQVIAQQQLDQWRTDAMTMLSEALPEMAGSIAEHAVKATFEHTQVDEAADAVSNTVIDIVNRIRLPFGR